MYSKVPVFFHTIMSHALHFNRFSNTYCILCSDELSVLKDTHIYIYARQANIEDYIDITISTNIVLDPTKMNTRVTEYPATKKAAVTS